MSHPAHGDAFRSDTKCCTYFPQLPGYLVGAILADFGPGMAEGKRRIRARIDSRVGVTPQWVTRPRKLGLVMQHGDGFGRATSLRCPYFDTSNLEDSCTIWRHREAVCLTYHCKFEGGQRGFDFWSALKYYLGFVQQRLASASVHAVAGALSEPVVRRDELTLEDVEDMPPLALDYARWWGAWEGREAELYVRCHDWVLALTPAAFLVLVDATSEGRYLLGALRAAHEKMEHKLLPEHLVRSARLSPVNAGNDVIVAPYHRYDPVAIDRDLFDAAGAFRGELTVAENLARHVRDGLSSAHVELLFAAGVLVAPDAAQPNRAHRSEDVSGRRIALLTILEARNLNPDDELLERIETAGAAMLDDWIRRAAMANAIEDVFAS